MEIEISNKIALRNAPHAVVDKLVRYLTIYNPKYQEAERLGRSTWGTPQFIYNFENIYKGISIPRGCRQRLFREIEKNNIKDVKVIDKRTRFDHIDIDSTQIKYRPYQFSPVIDLTTVADEGLLVAPPGSGKTVIGLSIIPMLGQPCMWLTHTNRLAKQVIERLDTFLPSLEGDDIGFIGGGKWQIGKIFTVGMVQTLIRNEKGLASLRDLFGLVILDEAHHCPATTFLKVINQFNPYYLYGLTATPYRRDKLEIIMFQAIGEATAIVKVSDVEKHGGIVIPTVKYRNIRSKPVLASNVGRIMTQHIIYNDKRNNIIVGDIVREAMLGNFSIVVSERKIHCEILHDLISIGWEKTGIATGDYSAKYQDEQVKRFYDNEITVLVTTFQLLGEGFDVDFLNRAFITTSFRAEGKVEQLVGRIQRSAEGKKDAIVYDYVDYDIGVLKDQFFSKFNKNKDTRCRAYERLGMPIEPYES